MVTIIKYIYGDVWEVDPRILHLGRLIPGGTAPLYPLNRGLVGPHCRLWRCAEYISSSARNRTGFPNRSPQNLVNVSIKLFHFSKEPQPRPMKYAVYVAKNAYIFPLYIGKKIWQCHSYFEPAVFLQRPWLQPALQIGYALDAGGNTCIMREYYIWCSFRIGTMQSRRLKDTYEKGCIYI